MSNVRPLMSLVPVFEALCGAIAVYTGIRWLVARKVPIVSEGGFKPLAWVEGRAAVLIGGLTVCVGLGLLAAAFGVLHLP
jgi:hypothetical protein